jgi:hypothetical protein
MTRQGCIVCGPSLFAYIPHMPEPHMPDEHPPPPMPDGILDAAESNEGGMALQDSGENVLEISFVISIPLHSGHERPSVPAPILCMTVNTLLHLLHLYSYIGILLPPALRLSISLLVILNEVKNPQLNQLL